MEHQESQLKWYDNRAILVLLFFVFPPLGIFAMTRHKTQTWKKLIYLVPSILFTLFFLIGVIGYFFIDSYKDGLDHYNKKDYIEAYNRFKLVRPSDKNYNDAIAKINELQPVVDSLNRVTEQEKLSTNQSKPKEIELTQAQKDSIASEKKQNDSLAEVSVARDKHKELIEKQFSAWDGSHTKLSIYIKENMNDPDSYEHISTKYWDMGDHLVVLTSYRGKNAFGAKIIAMTKAEVDMDGNVLKIIE